MHNFLSLDLGVVFSCLPWGHGYDHFMSKRVAVWRKRLGLGVGLLSFSWVLGIVKAQSQAQLSLVPAIGTAFLAQTGQVYQVTVATNLIGPRISRPWFLGNGQSNLATEVALGPAAFYQLQSNPVRDLKSLIEPIRVSNHAPGVACAVVVSNRLVGIGVTGTRLWDAVDAPIGIDDIWHHGSLTKSMTATLAAMLVEEGKIQWSTTLADVFPDWAPRMDPAWKAVTLEQLCSHRSGAPEDLNSNGIWSQLWVFRGTPVRARRLLLELLTVLPPHHPPGTVYEYSNAGFALAGAMLEKTLQTPWESLMTDRLFARLGMATGGFGVPATPRMLNQPWGHVFVNGLPQGVEPGTSADNPTAIGPAATVHCSVLDLARYAQFHLAGEQGDTPWLSHKSFVKLHADVASQGYALGWIVTRRSWADGVALTHSGSNTQWLSSIWLAPARQFAVIALTNVGDANGGNTASTLTDQIAATMIRTFLP